MDANEEMVRAAWELTHRCDGSYRGYPRGVVLLQDKHGHWLDFTSWAAAAEFTRERQEEIRQLREEIFYSNCGPNAIPVCKRILARLEAELAKLRQGMKSAQEQPEAEMGRRA